MSGSHLQLQVANTREKFHVAISNQIAETSTFVIENHHQSWDIWCGKPTMISTPKSRQLPYHTYYSKHFGHGRLCETIPLCRAIINHDTFGVAGPITIITPKSRQSWHQQDCGDELSCDDHEDNNGQVGCRNEEDRMTRDDRANQANHTYQAPLGYPKWKLGF